MVVVGSFVSFWMERGYKIIAGGPVINHKRNGAAAAFPLNVLPVVTLNI